MLGSSYEATNRTSSDSPGEKDRRTIETERLAELPGDDLQDVGEVERAGDFLEDVDDGDEMITLALQFLDPCPEREELRVWLPAVGRRRTQGVAALHWRCAQGTRRCRSE